MTALVIWLVIYWLAGLVLFDNCVISALHERVLSHAAQVAQTFIESCRQQQHSPLHATATEPSSWLKAAATVLTDVGLPHAIVEATGVSHLRPVHADVNSAHSAMSGAARAVQHEQTSEGSCSQSWHAAPWYAAPQKSSQACDAHLALTTQALPLCPRVATSRR